MRKQNYHRQTLTSHHSVTIISMVRLSSLVKFQNTTNTTYNNVDTNWMSVLEAYVSTICCCLPATRAVLRRLFPSCFKSSAEDSSTYNNRYSSNGKSPGGSKLTPIRVTRSVTQQRSHPRDGSNNDRSSTAGDSDIELVTAAQKETNRPEW